ncbi:unnamed protein product, partial [Nesidiocoris tenuis]
MKKRHDFATFSGITHTPAPLDPDEADPFDAAGVMLQIIATERQFDDSVADEEPNWKAQSARDVRGKGQDAVLNMICWRASGTVSTSVIICAPWRLKDSLDADSLLPADLYEIARPILVNSRLEYVSRRARINHETLKPKLFTGGQFHILTTPQQKITSDEKEKLAKLIQAGGGTLLAREPKTTRIDQDGATLFHAPEGSMFEKCSVFILFKKSPPEPMYSLPHMKHVSVQWAYLTAAEQDRERYAQELAAYKQSDAYRIFSEQQQVVKKVKEENEENSFQEPENNEMNGYDIPIFTEDFLDHNKSREIELRQLRKSNTDYEQQNATIQTYIAGLHSSIEKLTVETQQQRSNNNALTQHLANLRSTFANVLTPINVPSKSRRQFLNEVHFSDRIFKFVCYADQNWTSVWVIVSCG